MSRQKNDSERLLDEVSRWIVTIPSAETVDSHTVSIFIVNIIQNQQEIISIDGLMYYDNLMQIHCFQINRNM